MRKSKFRIKSSVLYSLCSTLILIILISITIYYKSYVKETVIKEVSYYSVDNSTYEVYYSGSNIVGGKTDEEGFIRKYTDHINFNFDYVLNFSDMVAGTQESLAKATLIIYAPNSETQIWKSDIDYLIPSKKIEYENTNRVKYNNKITIDYKKYLNIYEQFKNETSIVSKAEILVEFVNGNIAETADVPKITKVDTVSYSIPVSDVTFTIDKKTNITSKEKSVKTIVHNEDRMLYFYIIMLHISMIVFTISVMIARYINDRKRNGNYKNMLNKILKSYDNIIVNIKTVPSLKDKEVIHVTSFEELLDAQMEIRVPINYCEVIKNQESQFVIITNDMAWVYVLKKEGKKYEK